MIHRDHNGKISTMRVALLVACGLSIVMGIGGTVAVFYELPDANALILGATGILSSMGLAKGWQSMRENRNDSDS